MDLDLGPHLVDGAAGVPTVQALQAQYTLTPLNLWGMPGAALPERRDVYAPTEAAKGRAGSGSSRSGS